MIQLEERRDGVRGSAATHHRVGPGSFSALLEQLARPPEAPVGAAWAAALCADAVFDAFRLVRQLGQGGFGVVWEAIDTRSGTPVAFKALRVPDGARLREERLLREADVAARLSHPNIVALLEVGRAPPGPYLVLELLRGGTLAERLDAGPLRVVEAVRVAVEVARGIAHAHAHGVVHRDLKPANVFVCDGGAVKVLDFGLAHGFGLVKTHGGTPAYMAPEQLRGAPEDERTDVFALGVILHHMLAGELPFPDDGGLSLGGPDPAPTLEVAGAPGLGPALLRMLDKDPVRRPRDGAEVLAILAGAQRELAATAPPEAGAVRVVPRAPPPAPRPVRLLRRRRNVSALVALSLAAPLALVAVAGTPLRERVVEWLLHPRAAGARLAVLPFRTLGAGAAEEAFSAGLGEILANRLQQAEQLHGALRVVSAGEVQSERVASAREARAAFGATLALAGSVRWEPGRVTAAVSLVDAGTALVTASREVEARDAAALQPLLVATVAAMLQLELDPGALRRLTADVAPSPDAYALYLQGRGHLQRYDRAEDLDAAVAVFARALALEPTYALALAGAAEAHLRRYQLSSDGAALERARAAADRAARLGPRLAPVQLTLGLVQLASGDAAAAVGTFERALELEPHDAASLRELARAYDAAGRGDAAERAYRRAIQLRPDLWSAYKDLGVYHVRHGRMAEAVPLLERVVELTPDNHWGWSNLGGLYFKLGRRADAVAALERSIGLKATSRAHNNLAGVLFYDRRYAEAAQHFRSAAELNPSDSRVWGGLGDAQRWAGSAVEARASYRKALELLDRRLGEEDGNDAEAWSRVAAHRAFLGDRAGAEAAAERARRLAPRDGLVRFREALTFEDLHDRERALEAVGAALGAGYSREEILNIPTLARLREDRRFPGVLASAVDPR